jgi:hypothetical protein
MSSPISSKISASESDIQKAIEILKEGGYIKDEDLQPSKNQTKLNNVIKIV